MDPDPTPDPTAFFKGLKDAKTQFFHIFSSYLPTGTLPSVLQVLFFFFTKILCKNFILQALFQSAQQIYEKREGSGSPPLTNKAQKHADPADPDPVPDPQHWFLAGNER
jgi:hypothetical protein